MSKNSSAIAKISSVRISPCRMPKTDIPSRCSERGTGAISVCSIVPSQRSHWITRLMSSSTADRYAQTSVPISKKSTSARTSAPTPPTCSAISVIATVLTTP